MNKRDKEYDETLASCVPLSGDHKQKPSDAKSRLYTVTTIAKDGCGGTRTPVICDTFERAVEIVTTNEGDIWECSYMLAVIEAVEPNYLYRNAGEAYWFKWEMNGDMDPVRGHRLDGNYVPIETPEVYRNTFGFGIG